MGSVPMTANETPIQGGSPSPPVTGTPAYTAATHTEPALPSRNAQDLSHSASMYPAHVLGLTSSGSRINKNRRHTRHKMRYALSPLNIAMQHPLASECAVQQPLVLQPVFSEEDWNSINSRTSKRARQACKAAILKRQRDEQLQSDLAAAVQLNDSLNPAPRQRRAIERYTPPLPPAPPESPFVDSPPAQRVPFRAPVQTAPPVLVTQHSQLRPASSRLQTIKIGQQSDPNYAEVHFWTQPAAMDLSALAAQQRWKTQLQFNGRHSAFVTDKYLHSALVDDTVAANMAGTYFNHGHCSPDNPKGSLRGLMAIDSDLQSPQDLLFMSQVRQMVAAKPLSIQGMDKLNFLVGRAYCSDQESDEMCEHRDGSELAVAYSKQAPIVIVSTGEAAARLNVRLTPNCSVNSGPEAVLEFAPTVHAVHICCFSGPGAQCVRHKVTVPRGVQRFAYVLRSLQPSFKGLRSAEYGEQYQRLIHQCERASQPIWDQLTAAVVSGTVLAGSKVIAALRPPAAYAGAYMQPTGPTAWCLDLVGNKPYFGQGGPGSEFSSQPQVLNRIGMHVTPPGQALGLTSGGSPVLVSCVLDLTLCEYDAVPGTLTSSKYYADTVFLQQQRPERIIMHVPVGRSQARFLRGATASLQLQSPVRVLIKHSVQSGLLPFVDAAVLDCPRVIADPKSLLMHYLGLALVSEVSEVTFTLNMEEFSQPGHASQRPFNDYVVQLPSV